MARRGPIEMAMVKRRGFNDTIPHGHEARMRCEPFFIQFSVPERDQSGTRTMLARCLSNRCRRYRERSGRRLASRGFFTVGQPVPAAAHPSPS